MAQLLCHCYKFPVILPKVVAEDLPQPLADIADVKYLFYSSHGADGLQSVVEKVGVDLELQIFQLCLLVFQFADIVFLDQGIQFAQHMGKLAVQLCHLIVAGYRSVDVQITGLRFVEFLYQTPDPD